MQIRTLEELVEEYDQQLAMSVVDQDIYVNWKRSPVTERLMAECSRAVIEAIVDDQDLLLEDVETVAMRAAYVKGLRHAFEMVVDWRPSEIDDRE